MMNLKAVVATCQRSVDQMKDTESEEALISANVSTRAPETSGCLIKMLVSAVLKYRNKCFCLLLQVRLGFLML